MCPYNRVLIFSRFLCVFKNASLCERGVVVVEMRRHGNARRHIGGTFLTVPPACGLCEMMNSLNTALSHARVAASNNAPNKRRQTETTNRKEKTHTQNLQHGRRFFFGSFIP